MIREWQNRPLESVYAMVMLDAIYYNKMRKDGIVVKKAVYIRLKRLFEKIEDFEKIGVI